MTIEERANEYAKSLKATDILDYGGVTATLRANYIKIATEQKQIDIDKAKQAFMKACGWLKTTQSWFDAVFDEFIKELEKQD